MLWMSLIRSSDFLIDTERSLALFFQSGAAVDVTTRGSASGPASDPEDRLVSISGTLKSIEVALTMITETVSKVSTLEVLFSIL